MPGPSFISWNWMFKLVSTQSNKQSFCRSCGKSYRRCLSSILISKVQRTNSTFRTFIWCTSMEKYEHQRIKSNELLSRKRSLKVGWWIFLRLRHLTHVYTTDDHPHFLHYAADLAGALRNIIFVDQVRPSVLYLLPRPTHVWSNPTRSSILSLESKKCSSCWKSTSQKTSLRSSTHFCSSHSSRFIQNCLVQIGPDYFRQTVGIPQGSVLSTILCSFFYGDLEKKFAKYMDDPQSVTMISLSGSSSDA